MLKSWCKKNGFWNTTNLSHVFMDNGKISIPFDKLDDFYKIYIKSLESNEKVSVVEQKSEFYNFFMDLDYKDTEELTHEQVKSITNIICDKVNYLGGNESIISVSQPKKLKDGKIKSGIHINWKNFIVNNETALNIRNHIINTLTRFYIDKNWKDIVDEHVYKGSGLRLLWSHKYVKHDYCSGNGCSVCNNKGKIYEGPYVPIYEYSKDTGTTEIKKYDKLSFLKNTTIRSENIYCSVCVDDVKVETDKIKKEGEFSREQMENELQDVQAKSYLESFIRRYMNGQEKSYITKIFKHKDCFLLSTSSKYCENIRRDHNSNHIWFLVDEFGKIKQKCFCNCETLQGRRDGYCKTFTGREYTLDSETKNILFPIKKNKIINKETIPNVFDINYNTSIRYSSISFPKSKQTTRQDTSRTKKKSS